MCALQVTHMILTGVCLAIHGTVTTASLSDIIWTLKMVEIQFWRGILTVKAHSRVGILTEILCQNSLGQPWYPGGTYYTEKINDMMSEQLFNTGMGIGLGRGECRKCCQRCGINVQPTFSLHKRSSTLVTSTKVTSLH